MIYGARYCITTSSLHRYYIMPRLRTRRQQAADYPVSAARMTAEERRLIDDAAALRGESRSAYIARVSLREARADLRDAERKQQDTAAA